MVSRSTKARDTLGLIVEGYIGEVGCCPMALELDISCAGAARFVPDLGFLLVSLLESSTAWGIDLSQTSPLVSCTKRGTTAFQRRCAEDITKGISKDQSRSCTCYLPEHTVLSPPHLMDETPLLLQSPVKVMQAWAAVQ